MTRSQQTTNPSSVLNAKSIYTNKADPIIHFVGGKAGTLSFEKVSSMKILIYTETLIAIGFLLGGIYG